MMYNNNTIFFNPNMAWLALEPTEKGMESDELSTFSTPSTDTANWVLEPTEAKTNPTIEAINNFNNSEGKYLKVTKVNGKTQLDITSTSDAPLMLFRQMIDYCINSTLPKSLIGASFRYFNKCLGDDSTSLLTIAKFLKEHENEIVKSNLDINPHQKIILKQSLIELENKYKFQFTFIEKLFGPRTENDLNHHQAKLREIIDQSGIKESDISLLNQFEHEKSDTEIQQSISKIFQQCILPIYKSPMPKIATCQKNFVRIQIHDDSRKIYPKPKTVRCWHDSMHAGRVTFWTQVLIEVYKKYGRDTIPNKILSATGGGLHDSAREHEGTDYWDEESSFLFDHLLSNIEMLPEERKIHTFPLAEKDPQGLGKKPQGNEFTSDEQRILHDSDCIDIIRIVGSHFKPEFLCFYNFEDSAFDKDKLIKEVSDFIAYTEDQELKSLFENESTDFYGDLVRLLFKLEKEKPGRFELIVSLIETSMACYREDKDTDFIPKILELRSQGKGS